MNNNMTIKINEKLNSKQWSSNIAAIVMKKRKKKILFSSSAIGALATAAILVLAVNFNSTVKIENISYSSFITSQIDGTYNSVFTNETDLDSLIENTLALR